MVHVAGNFTLLICGHSIPGIPYFPFNRFNLDTIRSVIVPFLAFLTQGKSSEDIMPFSMTIMWIRSRTLLTEILFGRAFIPAQCLLKASLFWQALSLWKRMDVAPKAQWHPYVSFLFTFWYLWSTVLLLSFSVHSQEDQHQSIVCSLQLLSCFNTCLTCRVAISGLKISYKPVTPISRFLSPYAGPPSSKLVDQSWHDLLKNINLRVSGEEIRRTNQESITLPEGGGYLAWIGAQHQLHCIVSFTNDLLFQIELIHW